MFTTILGFLGLIPLIAVVAFAIWRGGPAERGGAIMVAIAWLGAGLANALVPHVALIYVLLTADTLLAVGFLVLAIRYSSRWLAVAMLLQGASLGFQAIRLMGSDPRISHHNDGFLIAINLLSIGILLTLLGGAVAAWRRRRRTLAAARDATAP